GFGFFNVFYPTGTGEIKNLVISGEVIIEAYETLSNKRFAFDVETDKDQNPYACAGAFAGMKPSGTFAMTNVQVKNAVIRSFQASGGLLGINLGGDNCKPTITACGTDNIKIQGTWYAGGFIGFNETSVTINGGEGGKDIAFDEIILEYGRKAWNGNAIGGVVGFNRNTNGLVIKNINVCKSDTGAGKLIKINNSNDKFNSGSGQYGAGGIVGQSRNPLKIQDCSVSDITIVGNRTGIVLDSLYGDMGSGETYIKNVSVNGDSKNTGTKASISNFVDAKDRGVGGIVGFNYKKAINIENCLVENYCINGYGPVGGCVGYEYDNTIRIYNFYMKNVSFGGQKVTYLGGVIGRQDGTLLGYDIALSSITTALSNYNGDITGIGTKNIIVGFSRHNTPTTKLMANSNTYNTNISSLYVVFSDYEGTSLEDTKNNAFPGLKSKSQQNSTIFTNVDTAEPYATVNPVLSNISFDDLNGGSTNFLVSDGISQSAIDDIIKDFYDTTVYNRYLQWNDSNLSLTTLGVTVESGEITNYGKISTFQAELGDVIDADYDFPMLVIDDSSKADDMINAYLRMLTNTKFDFTYGNKSINNSYDVGTVNVYRSKYDKASKKFTLDQTDVNLKQADTFIIRQANGKYQYDTANADGQFTLLDVAFVIPGGNHRADAAYHLYVPSSSRN
ncbi:hypothetical protein, partial [Ruminococcus sp.]|uniref:hypothetical protein n=1 Tax=Ruminococcus sp. TaxID=41978 RepID=UPI00258C6BA6